MLKFENEWRFDSPGSIGKDAVQAFAALISQIASQGDRKDILEHFKEYFAGAAGASYSRSSTASWSETDLHIQMRAAAGNAALFIDAFYTACEKLHDDAIEVPGVRAINKLLKKEDIPFEIQLPYLVSAEGGARMVVEVPVTPPSLDKQAREIIEQSYAESQRLLSEERWRPAVQEILWLLESVSTAFEGVQTPIGGVQGKYFLTIVDDLKRLDKNSTLERVINWILALYGYLSSPTGGGIRHGARLKSGMATKPDEARLYCNLIRSYIAFLLAEHHRLKGSHKVLDK